MVDGVDIEGIKNRLKGARNSLNLSQRAMAEKLGMSVDTLKKIENSKSIPGGDTLLKYEAIGIDSRWILTGIEARAAIADPQSGQLDRDLFGQVTDAIAKLYKIEGVHLPIVELGRLSADKYQEIIASGAQPEGYSGAIAMAIFGLQKDLRAAAADPANSKRRASE